MYILEDGKNSVTYWNKRFCFFCFFKKGNQKMENDWESDKKFFIHTEKWQVKGKVLLWLINILVKGNTLPFIKVDFGQTRVTSKFTENTFWY